MAPTSQQGRPFSQQSSVKHSQGQQPGSQAPAAQHSHPQHDPAAAATSWFEAV
jgi:hypothetical protein